MESCLLELGAEPFERLAAGPVEGTVRWGGDERPVKVRLRGAHSRRFPKKSLQLDFPVSPLPDEPPAGHTVRRIHVNADYVDPTLMRSSLSFSLFHQMDVLAPLTRHVWVQVNGVDAGLYVAVESVDRRFCRRRSLPPGPIFYALNRNADFGLVSPFSGMVKEPLEAGYRALRRADPRPLRRLLMAINLSSWDTFLSEVQRWIDLKSYLRWVMVAVFVGNRDGFAHNYALYLNPESDRFQIIPWDYDATWGVNIHGRPARLDRVPVTGWNNLSRRLFALSSVCDEYRRTFRKALDGPLSPDAVKPLIDRMSEALAPWVEKEMALRGASCQFEAEVERLRWWAEQRRLLLLEELNRL